MRAFVRWFEPAMDVDTILDREYNIVGEAEVVGRSPTFTKKGRLGFTRIPGFVPEILQSNQIAAFKWFKWLLRNP